MDIIAERIYYIASGDISLKIFKPIFDGNVWQCGYEIHWPNKGKKTRFVDGLDSMESLLMAFRLAEDFLEMIQREDKELLRWQAGMGLGLRIEFDEKGE